MGASASKETPVFSVNVKHKKDETIQTILRTKHFKFALLMRANQTESDRLQERWQDFTSKVRDDFIYHAATNNPQHIKVIRDGDKMYFTQSTTIEIDETDVKNLTKMFDTITVTIKDLSKTNITGLVSADNGSSASSLNLLVTDKVN